MPQVELHFTKGLSIDDQSLFAEVERVINEIDDSAGMCKSRVYCVENYRHDHLLLRVLLMRKPHRDPAFMKDLHQRLLSIAKPLFPTSCAWSVLLDFSSEYYTAGENKFGQIRII